MVYKTELWDNGFSKKIYYIPNQIFVSHNTVSFSYFQTMMSYRAIIVYIYIIELDKTPAYC